MKQTTFLSVAVIGILLFSSFSANQPTKPVDLANFDKTVKPGDNFYQYVNGTWIKNNPVPDTETRWGSFSIVDETIKARLKEIVEELKRMRDLKQGSAEQKIRDYYLTAMDVEKMNSNGITPIKNELEKIESLGNYEELMPLLAYLNSIGVRPFFYSYVGQDDKVATEMILSFYQGGLGLPDRDYYLKENDENIKITTAYKEHITKMFELIQLNEPNDLASSIFQIEKQIAEASKSRVELRDPEANYNKLSLDEFEVVSPGLNWNIYIKSLYDYGLNPDVSVQNVIVGQKEFFEKLTYIILKTPINEIKNYLKWNLINSKGDLLGTEMEKADFDFYEGVLRGAKEMKPRWKRTLDAINGSMGELLGQIYVKKHFSPEAKKRVEVMVDNLIVAYKERIMSRTWMAPETKKAALAKLEKITTKLAYPDKWRDYSTLEIKPENSYYDNSVAIARYALRYNLNKLGKPIDKTEWGMSPQTVNAYYNPGYNEIVFPAAIMQPPFFYPDGDDAVNYGAMGAVIGHEITHGFDDQGNQFDADGNLRNWWTDEDKKRFRTEADKLVAQYSSYVALDDLKVNGELTQGENIADLGGLTMAYAALQIALAKNPQKTIDGFTPEQRFFISFAQVWRNNIRDAELKRRLKVDVHSPGKFRTLGPLSNMPEFYKAFEVTKGQSMFRTEDERVEIW
ncbi:MAG: M13 family metallopeptidase [Bacteroidetes bacterium]|nr:M13 family metallopeptidase [Bacteroidota bacterium]